MRLSPVLVPFAVAVAAATAAPAVAQAPQPGPNVGDVAPDFAGPTATKAGPTGRTVRLADLKGQTVVLAFFPRARTKGCTVQLETYRDQYAELFRGGEGVTLLAISTDADTTLAAWAREADFPFTLVSDAAGTIGKAYGTLKEPGGMAARFLYVIGPDGRVVHTQKPFNVMAPQAYTDLGDAVRRAATGSR